MKNKVLLFVSLIALGGITSCNNNNNSFDGEVTDLQWQDAFEQIVNYKKNYRLNYKTTGVIGYGVSEFDCTYVDDLQVNGDFEKYCIHTLTPTKEEDKKYGYVAKIENSNCYAHIKNDLSSLDRVEANPIRDEFAIFFDGIYDARTNFQFIKDSKIYKYKIGDNFLVSLKFNENRKISNLYCKYIITGSTYFYCELTYEYGTSSFKVYEGEWNKSVNKMRDTLSKSGDQMEINYLGESLFNGDTRIIKMNNCLKDLKVISSLYNEGRTKSFWESSDSVTIFKNGQYLNLNSDYTFNNVDRSFTLSTPSVEGDNFEVLIKNSNSITDGTGCIVFK